MMSPELFKNRIEFVLELATHLHASGTSVNRLEGAIGRVAKMLELEISIWSNPTGIMISFIDCTRGEPYTVTRVLRLKPGDTHLGRLADADAIAERVMAGLLDIESGLAQLKTLTTTSTRFEKIGQILCFGVASALVISLFPRTGWFDLLSASVLGCLVGALVLFSVTRARFSDALEAIAAFVITILAAVVATFIAPLTFQAVVISALITLMPGMMLTLAVNELATQQLASGSARFAGALTILMKLTFGSLFATQLVQLIGMPFISNASSSALPAWMGGLMLLPGAFALAILFKTNRRDIPIAMSAVLLGYGVIKACALVPALANGEIPVATFLAAFVVTAVSNIYARWRNRPGALIRVPGIILLVPGSLGFRSINVALVQDVNTSLDLAMAVLAALIALVAGILFGNLLAPVRRNL